MVGFYWLTSPQPSLVVIWSRSAVTINCGPSPGDDQAKKCDKTDILVGGLEHEMTFQILGIIDHPKDELHHFSEGWLNHQPVSGKLLRTIHGDFHNHGGTPKMEGFMENP